jgi:transposase InsO family protein
VPHDLRDTVVDFLSHYSQLTSLAMRRLLGWLELSPRQFGRWQDRYGKANEHNAMIPRDHWIEPQERAAIETFARDYPLEGYRRLTFMMLDRDVAAVSPATTYRVLKAAGIIGARHQPASRKGQGFVQPLAPHEHWHVDFSYVNIGGTFYYLCSVLDGCSRAILAWDIRPQMQEADAEIVLQRAREAHPQARPRIITDNGPQFVARDFKDFIRLWQTTHVFCSPHYPQSNGKLERYHRTLKEQAIRPKTPLSLADAKRVVTDFIDHYNTVRLHSAIGYITPADRLATRQNQIFAARDKKLETARQNRRIKRHQSYAQVA